MLLICEEDSPFLSILKSVEIAANHVLAKYIPELTKQTDNNEILVNFISDEIIHELNLKHRQKDKPTDVLSWSFIDDNLLPYEIAGEIYVSLDTARRYSVETNQPLIDVLMNYVIHALLHVYHYDHNTDEEEDNMNAVADEIFQLIKISC
jgi:probable rRNA maturation factor